MEVISFGRDKIGAQKIKYKKLYEWINVVAGRIHKLKNIVKQETSDSCNNNNIVRNFV